MCANVIDSPRNVDMNNTLQRIILFDIMNYACNAIKVFCEIAQFDLIHTRIG